MRMYLRRLAAALACAGLVSGLAAAPDGFSQAEEVGQGWWYQRGLGFLQAMPDGWSWHSEHGSWWAAGGDFSAASGVFLWHQEKVRWMWSREGLYPWVYVWSANRGWGYYPGGGGSGASEFIFAAGPIPVRNAGFEDSLTNTWLQTKPVGTGKPGAGAFQGSRSLKLGAGGRADQVAYLEAGRRYRVRAQVFGHGSLGVHDLGYAEPVLRSTNPGASWQPLETVFVATGSPAFVRCAYGPGSGDAYVDAVELEDITSEADLGTAAPTPVMQYPSQVFDTSRWKITLPVSLTGGGSPTEIHSPELARTHLPPWFRLAQDADGYAVAFRANHAGSDGVTTGGSSNPRSELREMLPRYEIANSASSASWSSGDGRTHAMFIRQKVVRLTSVKPQTVVGQIHDTGDDITVFRVEGHQGGSAGNQGTPGVLDTHAQIWITNGDTSHGYLVDPNYELGTVFTVKFIVKDDVIAYEYNGVRLPYTQRKKVSGCYFKAGNYTQSHRGTAPNESTEAYAETWIYDLQVSHE